MSSYYHKFIPGAAFFGKGEEGYGVIPLSAGTNIRHSFTLQFFISFSSSTEAGNRFIAFAWIGGELYEYSSYTYFVSSSTKQVISVICKNYSKRII